MSPTVTDHTVDEPSCPRN